MVGLIAAVSKSGYTSRQRLLHAKRCLAEGHDINAQDSNGDSALIIACKRNSLTLMRFLIDSGVDVNLANRQGRTVLHYAVAEYFSEEKVCLLLKSGAESSLKDNNSKTAKDRAIELLRHSNADYLESCEQQLKLDKLIDQKSDDAEQLSF